MKRLSCSRRVLARFLTTTIASAAASLLGGCGGCGGGGSDAAMMTVALTDAASDEIASFTVDLTSIQLMKRGGGVAGVLATPVNVDLVTLQDLSQILDVTSVPAGLYDGASVTFDFASARCVLVNQTSPATLLDRNGNPLTGPVTLPLSLGGAPLDAAASRHRLLELDFDLDQSLNVDAAANQVEVAPTLVVKYDRSDAKELIAMGALVSVAVAKSHAIVDLETLGGTFLRRVTFMIDPAAVVQVDGVPSVGMAGVNALAALPAGTWVQGCGSIDPLASDLVITYLEAGKGTWNGGSDILEGHVVGRSGGAGSDATLTVLGHSQDASHSSFVFNTLFTVDLSFANTKVVRRGDATAFDSDELNVGQLVRVFGALSGTTMDATSAASVVREQPTRVLGFSVGAPGGGTVVMNLDRVDLRLQSDFAWAQGGTTPPDPTQLQIEVGSLADNLNIVDTTPVVARGFFSGVADNGADFVATDVVNRDQAPSVLVLRDRVNGFTVATSTSASQIQFTITGSQGPLEVAAVDRGFVGVTDLPTSPTPTVVPDPKMIVYVLVDAVSSSVTVDRDFADFSAAIGSALTSGRRLIEFHAVGPYDSTSNTLSAVIASAVIF